MASHIFDPVVEGEVRDDGGTAYVVGEGGHKELVIEPGRLLVGVRVCVHGCDDEVKFWGVNQQES